MPICCYTIPQFIDASSLIDASRLFYAKNIYFDSTSGEHGIYFSGTPGDNGNLDGTARVSNNLLVDGPIEVIGLSSSLGSIGDFPAVNQGAGFQTGWNKNVGGGRTDFCASSVRRRFLN
jgi:hypothetical protein